jgi:KaiC/GvpD/RAD55 family RecA-like ATPase
MPTGPASGWGVVDIDFKEIETEADTLTSSIGQFFTTVRPMGRLLVETQRGFHLYVPWTPDFGGNQHGETTHIDIRGEGGYVVLWGGDPGKAPKDESSAGQVIGYYNLLKNVAKKQRKERNPNTQDADLVISEGEGRNEYLTSFAGSLRNLGKSVEQIKADIRSENEAVCNPPLTEAELERTIFKSLAKWEQGAPLKEARLKSKSLALADFPELLTEAEIDLHEYYRSEGWWVEGFVPKNKLIVMFGEGGIGKSTLGVSFAKAVAEAGGQVVLIHTGEENQYSMLGKAIASEVPLEQVKFWGDGRGFLFPSNVDAFSEFLDKNKPDYVYFDNMMDVMDDEQSYVNEATRTRNTLQPLAALAQQHKCTILVTSHRNKAGAYSGSTQIKAVVRHMLVLDEAGANRAKLEVYKSNMVVKGTKAYFRIEPVTITQKGKPILKADGKFAEETRMVPVVGEDGETEESVKDKVRTAIIGLLDEQVLVPRAAINERVAEYKLSATTVTGIINELIKFGDVIRDGKANRTLYRRPTLAEVDQYE